MTAWLGLLGAFSIMASLVMFGLICRRFGQATGSPPYYLAHFLGAFLVGVGLFARAVSLVLGVNEAMLQTQAPAWALLFDGLPALGLTVALVAAWRYWSWLLADRD